MGCKSQEQGGSSGLAFLVHNNPASNDTPSQTALLLDYVFQLPQPASDIVSRSGDIQYPDLTSRVTQHIKTIKQEAAHGSSQGPAAGAGPSSSSMPSVPEQPRGRVGPRDVAIDRSSVCGSFGFSTDGLSLEALGNFTSCRANVAVFAGKWFYECTVLTSGIQQIGWATIHCPFTAEEGVGDAPDSYAVDGKRLRKWNVKPQPYGESWVQGDVMGCGIDLDAGSITFWRNGQCLGVAYDRVRTMQPSLAYFPAVSLSHTERCTLNFGAKPFTYHVEGYQPLQAAPSAADRLAADYCCSCMARLALTAVERPEHGSSDGGSSATATSVAAGEKEYSLVDHLEGVSVSAAPSAASVAAVAAAAAAAAAARAPTGAPAAAGGLAAGWAPPFAGPPQSIASADMLLLSSVVLGPLQELLVLQPYLVQSALLPLLTELQRMAGEGAVQPQLQLVLQLMHVVWDDSTRDILFAVLEELAYRCQVSPLLVQDYPYTAAYPHLQLAGSLLQHKPTMRLFVKHPDFYIVMEGLLARKAPSPKDLQQLLPHVWWKGCKDETASEERLRASVSIITTTVAKVEQRQCELLELLLATPWSDEAPGSSASSTSSSASTSSSCALLVFLRFLLQKNMYALRDVSPPGLSEPTVLMSAFFGLLQMLQPALQAACVSGSGPLAAFPAAELFAGVGPAAEAEPVFNMPRLGGVVTHLAREHPITAAERQLVGVLQQQPVGRRAEGSAYGGSPHLQDAWVPELLNSCLLLYAWRVGFNYKMIHNLSSTVISSSTALEDLDRMIAQNDGQQMSSWLHGTRKVYHDELSRDVRLLTLLCVAFFSPGKQAALCSLSRYLAQLTTAVSNIQPSPAAATAADAEAPAAPADSTDAAAAARVGGEGPQRPSTEQQRAGAAAAAAARPAPAAAEGVEAGAGLSNLLRYVPLVYVEVVVDFLTALRKSADCAVGTPAIDLQPQAATAFITWCCCVLNNPRIANPDVQESLLAVVGLLLDNPAWRELLEQQQGRARQLVGGLLQVFDSRLWHPTTGVLLKVIQNSGFGHPARQPHPTHSLQHVLISLLQEGAAPAAASASAAASPTRPHPQQQLHEVGEASALAAAGVSLLPSPPAPTAGMDGASAAAAEGAGSQLAGAACRAAVARGFVNRLFSTLNWTLTEFTVAVGELHNLRGQRSILEVQNQYRRTGLMFELSVNFLRLLEFVVPTPAFLAVGVNRTRLRELLQFVLSHFTNGPDARRLNELLQTSQPAVASSSSGGGAAPPPAAAAGGAAAAAAGGATGRGAGVPAAAAGAPPPLRQGPMQPSPAAVAAVAAAAPLSGGPLSAGGVGQGAPGVPAYALQALRLESSSLSERVQKTALLAPLVGIFLALWDSYLAATAAAVPSLGPAAAAAAAAAAALEGDVAAAVASAGDGGDGGCSSSSSRGESAVLQELAEMADERFMASLRFLQDVDWSAAFPSQPLSVPVRAFGQLIDAVTAARTELAAAAAAQQLPEDVPDDFLDPITMELMKEPVVLPDSQIVVDRSTIERHLLSSATDPFSRAALTMEQLQPATDISRRMREWVEEHRAAARAQQQQQQQQQLQEQP